MAGAAQLDYPDGITDDHAADKGWLARHASPLSLVILGALLLAALLGAFGGGKARPLTVSADTARITVTTPRVLRNGLFFETHIDITAKADIADLVIAVPPALWRDMTINTMIPAATEESFERGSFRFSYGTLARGDTLSVKIDGQINPPLFAGTKGKVAVLDGDRPIGEVPFSIRVLP